MADDLTYRPGPYDRKIIASEPIPGTRSGKVCTLECGHVVRTFGNLALASDGVVLCTLCRERHEGAAD